MAQYVDRTYEELPESYWRVIEKYYTDYHSCNGVRMSDLMQREKNNEPEKWNQKREDDLVRHDKCLFYRACKEFIEQYEKENNI